jgi:hypothetical protein
MSGRATRFDPIVGKTVVEHIADGRTVAQAAKSVGVTARAVYGWRKAGLRESGTELAEFAKAYDAAMSSRSNATAVKVIERVPSGAVDTELALRACHYISEGCSIPIAAECAGLSRREFHQWLINGELGVDDESVEVLRKVRQARAQVMRQIEKRLHEVADSDHKDGPRVMTWLLERMESRTYGKRDVDIEPLVNARLQEILQALQGQLTEDEYTKVTGALRALAGLDRPQLSEEIG